MGRRSAYRCVGVVASSLALGSCGTLLQALDPIQLKVERSTTYYDVRGVTSDEIIEYLEEESKDLRATIDRLVEQLKFTW